jgi:hypothetical protein
VGGAIAIVDGAVVTEEGRKLGEDDLADSCEGIGVESTAVGAEGTIDGNEVIVLAAVGAEVDRVTVGVTWGCRVGVIKTFGVKDIGSMQSGDVKGMQL